MLLLKGKAENAMKTEKISRDILQISEDILRTLEEIRSAAQDTEPSRAKAARHVEVLAERVRMM